MTWSRFRARSTQAVVAMVVITGLGLSMASTAVAAEAQTSASIAGNIEAVAGPSVGGLTAQSQLVRPNTGSTAAVNVNGLTVWQNVMDGVSYASRTVSGGTQQFIHIAGSQAPTSFTFSVADGYTAESGPDGSVILVNPAGQPTSLIAPPWAKDATGKSVPTRYEIANSGNSLIQVVEHRASGVTYPVVADPWFSWYWWGYTVRFSRWETQVIGSGIATVGKIFGWTGWPATAAKAAAPLAKWAASNGYCLSVSQVYGTWWNAYSTYRC